MAAGWHSALLASRSHGERRRTDGRARDLWALGLLLAELGSADVAHADEPASVARRIAWPSPLGELVGTLLSPVPAARASAAWVHRRALRALGEDELPELVRSRRQRAIRRAYLALRRADVLGAARAVRVAVEVGGEPRRWLEEAITVASRVSELRGERASGKLTLGDLGTLGRSRWLVAVVGPSAASWPVGAASDRELGERLLELALGRDPASFTWQAIERGHAEPSACPRSIRWSSGYCSARVGQIRTSSTRLNIWSGRRIPALGVGLGRALRLKGELGRALVVLERVGTPQAAVEAAETARRARDDELVCRWLERAEMTDNLLVRARATAVRARLRLDQSDASGALELLRGVPEIGQVLETRALGELASGDLEAAEQSVARARVAATSEEEHARAAAVAAWIAHSRGEADAALGAFRRAAEHAARAGAVLEEATYLTGVAAAAAIVGELGEALDGATRATLLFEWLGRPADAARRGAVPCFGLRAGGSRERDP